MSLIKSPEVNHSGIFIKIEEGALLCMLSRWNFFPIEMCLCFGYNQKYITGNKFHVVQLVREGIKVLLIQPYCDISIAYWL